MITHHHGFNSQQANQASFQLLSRTINRRIFLNNWLPYGSAPSSLHQLELHVILGNRLHSQFTFLLHVNHALMWFQWPLVFLSFAFSLSTELRHLSHITPSIQAFLLKEDLKAWEAGQEVLEMICFSVRACVHVIVHDVRRIRTQCSQPVQCRQVVSYECVRERGERERRSRLHMM